MLTLPTMLGYTDYMKLYNTAARKLDEFSPIDGAKVRIYSCGPTVYWNQHLGHMYAYVQWDCLVRALRYEGYDVDWVMNITDVGHLTSDEDTGEDKMEKGAKRENMTVWQIAEKYIDQFKDSMRLLNIQEPNVLCRATDHIQDQIELIKKIEANGFTYKTQTGLVFDTSKFPDYAKFARLNLEKQKAGARVEEDKEKRQPWDFLLWVTNQPNHIMKWESPWRVGFPGWHIECTAMSVKYLGEPYDIHTGGKEHIPVHHTNEIAQAFGAFGHPIVNYWLHNEWLVINGEKMSKSLGNMVTMQNVIAKGYDPLAHRYLILNSHYRTGLNFTWETLDSAQTALFRLRDRVNNLQKEEGWNIGCAQYEEEFMAALNDDLNLPAALAVVWKMLDDKDLADKAKLVSVLRFDDVLGLEMTKKQVAKQISPEAAKLIAERKKLRAEKKFAEADKIRVQLEEKGVKVEDEKL